MAKYKILKSVAHNLAASFASSMNYAGYDYTMGVLIINFKTGGPNRYEIDLVSDEASAVFSLYPLRGKPEQYREMYRANVLSQGSSLEKVHKASLTVEFTAKRRKIQESFPSEPFICRVSITDDRGKVYSHEIKDNWYAESTLRPGFVTWIRTSVSYRIGKLLNPFRR